MLGYKWLTLVSIYLTLDFTMENEESYNLVTGRAGRFMDSW